MRVRIRFDEHGKIRFLSHRDVARVWERALRRANVAVAYSEGFSPRPKLSFGLALSTGHESEAEYLDVELRPDAEVVIHELPDLLTPLLPDGMAVQAAVPLEQGSASLQQAVTSCSWRIELGAAADGDVPDAVHVSAAVERLLEASEVSIEIERKGTRTLQDVRPGVLDLRVDRSPPAGSGVRALREVPVLVAELATQPRSLRPAELLRALDPSYREGLVTRTHQWTSVDGARCEPIGLHGEAATSAPHAGARAS